MRSFATNWTRSLCLILRLNSYRSHVMPLFSSSSPFDQDVGKIQRTVGASLVEFNITNLHLFTSSQRKLQANSTQQMTGNLLWKYVIVFRDHRVGKGMFFFPNHFTIVCRRSLISKLLCVKTMSSDYN